LPAGLAAAGRALAGAGAARVPSGCLGDGAAWVVWKAWAVLVCVPTRLSGDASRWPVVPLASAPPAVAPAFPVVPAGFSSRP